MANVHDGVVPVAVDLGAPAGPEQLVQGALDAHGRVDVLVNNVGGVRLRTEGFLALDDAEFEWALKMNFFTTLRATRAVLPGMRKKRYGRIVNISSQLAYKGGEGMAHYAAAKAGILGITRSLAYEVTADNIAVNAICPGPIDTDMKLPPEWASKKQSELVIGRQGKVEEIAPTALLLACEEAAFYVGASFHPNGGDIMV